MRYRIISLLVFILIISGQSCKKDTTQKGNGGLIQIVSVKIGTTTLDVNSASLNVAVDQPVIFSFSVAIDTVSIKKLITLKDSNGSAISGRFTASDNLSVLTFTSVASLQNSTDYTLTVSSRLHGINGETFPGVEYKFTSIAGTMTMNAITLDGLSMTNTSLLNINPGKINILVTFSQPLNPANYTSSIVFTGPSLNYSLSADEKTISATASSKAQGLSKYSFAISTTLTSAEGYRFAGFSSAFYTGLDSVYKFPQISDNDLLTLIQQQTFKYFWDFGHPQSGMARERNSSGDVVTTGGSGFGIMSMVVAMQRGFITKTDGINRLDKILGFLETSDRFHGAWPHWLNGTTGKTVPFSAKDNGGDIVETSYMIQGLLTMRQFLDSTITVEKTEINRINKLFNAVEFDWFTNGEKTLYWEWSPDYGYNLRIQGYNETLITYLIAASSKTHSISKDTYTNGYADNGSIRNGKSYYGYLLPLGSDYGGPLFFTQYSFLGLDPRHLADQYADYWQQNVNQSLINWSYCVANPQRYPGYGPGIWGLTASDNPWGYNAQSPTNDLGVITPTAAISSIAYTPTQSLNAIRTFYYFLGDRLWGDYGFYDAFDIKENWWASSTLAIDEGPIICMIENYRTSLLWNLFMSAPEVQNGLTKLGFTY